MINGHICTYGVKDAAESRRRDQIQHEKKTCEWHVAFERLKIVNTEDVIVKKTQIKD